MKNARSGSKPLAKSGLAASTECKSHVMTTSVCKPDLPPYRVDIWADARSVPTSLAPVDLVVTSPPYWKKRDYGFDGQIGQEDDPKGYAANIVQALRSWRAVLAPHGSVFLNVGDTYHRKSLAAVPARLEAAAVDDGWIIRNRIIWAKESGMPEPSQTRLANRHEYILHLTPGHDYYYDMQGYAVRFGNGANPGDVWTIGLRRNMGKHLAPFPDELVERAITLACPLAVCTRCGQPRRRVVSRTAELDPRRPQAARAMELAKEKGLTAAHIAAVQATGISDAGKAMFVQSGTGRNRADVRRLAAEAKVALGGYFREFTFARKDTAGWTSCGCGAPTRPGLVMDPFHGTGTTARVAATLGRSVIGIDLAPVHADQQFDKAANVRTDGKMVRSDRRRSGSVLAAVADAQSP